ncbi:glyoxylate/hydroxypyruvate reductase A [Rhodobacteraceae bacterium WD3A24]|nr:glyoxylate/hydroxypyruvate reductase A [Rhodobacteraceae bacterium WD3A24]
MTINAYFAAGAERWPEWRGPLERAFAAAGLDVALTPTPPQSPGKVDYIIFAPGGDIEDFRPFTGCKTVLNIWAGVENVVANPTLTQPLCRMVDPGLTEGMVEYVVAHALRHHLGIDAILGRQDGTWRHEAPPLAREQPVAMLGLGALGRACAEALARLNFPVMGWSSTPKDIPTIECHSGDDGLEEVLRRAQIVVTLLPHTPETENLIGAWQLSLLPRGAVLINPGRGALIDDAALISVLDDGRLAHATLDVFRTEPLPADHPFWSHPGVTVTPHIAAETRPETAAPVVAENIRRAEAGEPLLHVVDRSRGY